MDVISGSVDRTSSSEAKIALFRSLFRGRDNVYPRRFESRTTGRSGYAPACANEWVRGVCEKPRIKCAECPNRRFLPVTDDVMRWHLSGHDAEGQHFVAGVYPLLQDETCFFLAVDFDKAGWRENAMAFLDACRHLNLPVALKRSRSGRGAHNTLFLDSNLVPWVDQWAFLSSLRKIGRPKIEHIVEDAVRRGRVLGVRLPPQEDGETEPWTAPPSRHRKESPIVGELPSTLQLVLGNQIYIAKQGLHPGLRNRLLRLAAFQNPEFSKAQAMRVSTYNKARVVACADDLPHHIGLPRGCLDDVCNMVTEVR